MNKYSIIAISTILVLGMFMTFSSEDINSDNYDYSGLVSGIEKSSKGYTFDFMTNDQSIRCYYSEKPSETYYNINGEFSEDGEIFFISSMSVIA